MNSTAASQRISGLRTDCLEREVHFVKSGPFASIGPLPWCMSAFHSVVKSHPSSLQYRQFSLSATANSNGSSSVRLCGSGALMGCPA